MTGPPLNVGVSLGLLSPRIWLELTAVAEEVGLESVWIPEHLVLPVRMTGSPRPGDSHPPVPPDIPVFDPWVYLSFLAGRTRSLRLGTFVFLLGIRHPFVSARAIATLDTLSAGRTEVGIGAGWLESEWHAVGLDFESRGRRLDEALGVCQRLWTEREVEHHGEFYSFEAVMFEPKPLQQPHPPIHVGGVSDVALRRAARIGDGWIGMNTSLDEVVLPVRRLHELRSDLDRQGRPFQVTVAGPADRPEDLEQWAEAGVTRLLLNNLGPSRDAVVTLRRRADRLFG